MASNNDIEKLPYTKIKEDIITQDHLYKLIIIGDSGVGKSCILLRGMKDEFKSEHDITIGVEFGSFSIKLNNKVIKLQIWDTAGQETFQSVTKVFYKGAHCIFLVYDITKEDTFTRLESWMKEIRESSSANVMIYLVGNKQDMEEHRAVATEKAIEFKKKEGLEGFVETSAKSGINVENLFVQAAKLLYTQTLNKQIKELDGTKALDYGPNGAKHKKGCSC